MPTTQLPFFLSSDRASELDATGSRFRVKLNPPIDIPRAATHTRVFVQEASVVYSMKNVNSTNNTFEVQLGIPTVGAPHVYTLSIEEGLYDALDEIEEAIVKACVASGHVPSIAASTVNDPNGFSSHLATFKQQYFELVPDYTRSRVRAVSRSPGFGLLNSSNSPLMTLLGFKDSDPSAIGRTAHYHLTVTNFSQPSHYPDTPPPLVGNKGNTFALMFKYQTFFGTTTHGAQAHGYDFVYEFVLAPGVYSPEGLKTHINNIIRANRDGATSDPDYARMIPSPLNPNLQTIISQATLDAGAGALAHYDSRNATITTVANGRFPEHLSSAGNDVLQISSFSATIDGVLVAFNNIDVSSGTCFISDVRVSNRSGALMFHSMDQTPTAIAFSNQLGMTVHAIDTGGTQPNYENVLWQTPLGSSVALDTRAVANVSVLTATTSPARAGPLNTTTVMPYTAPAWVSYLAGVSSELATNSANIDRVNSLAIAAPGLASGVHMNGDVGACTLCRFPVTGTRGSVIQFVPINPIKSTYPLQGSTLSNLNIELLDQNGERVDTQGEGFSLTLVVEYDMD
jgi:hypothetical protein